MGTGCLGKPVAVLLLADHVTFAGGVMDIRLDNVASSGQPYSSGEYRTTGYYGYGCYEASFKPVPRSGVVSSFFTFAGPYDNGGNGKHNEIDFEFLGRDTNAVQVNFWTNDDAYSRTHERLFPLFFDASAAFHRYGFKWTSKSIAWFVDGAFTYPGAAVHGVYDWVRYIAGENCTFDNPPGSPPPPTGSATSATVQQVSMAIDSRASQAIARVTIVDNLGSPVAGATVSGAWSGVITAGDASRTTDSLGLATFYSSRSKTPGLITFCVTSVVASGLAYLSSGSTCSSITK